MLSSNDIDDAEPVLAYEIMQGPLVRWSRPGAGVTPPTAVLVHGILGQRRNMQGFARMLLQACPAWQILLVDLRCHGESASLFGGSCAQPPHNVGTAASDLLELLRSLKLFPFILIGHSFGGKVVMSMVKQFGQVLPRPVQVWVLDSLPGAVRAGPAGVGDHPARLIDHLKAMPMPTTGKAAVVKYLQASGFSDPIAQWAATNLRPAPAPHGVNAGFLWTFNLDGVKEMYESYEETDMYPLLEAPPLGLKLDFVKAERSSFRWADGDEDRILQLGHGVHLLKDSGHWVHTDNPYGLYDILIPSFVGSAAQISAVTGRRPALR